MREQEPWYVEHRAESWAIVYLTRRTDLIVTRDAGLDLLVHIDTGEETPRRVFGVQIEASARRDRLLCKDDAVFPDWLEKLASRAQSLSFPLCLFVFIMPGNTCDPYYLWLKEPIVGPEGPRLETNIGDPRVQPLDNAAIGHIVNRINDWYEASRPSATTRAAASANVLR